MTLAGSMCSVPQSLSMEVSYPPLSSSSSVEADITLTGVTALLYHIHADSHFTGVLKYP